MMHYHTLLKRFFFLIILQASVAFGAPTITSISPNFGPASGGNTVMITGSGFTDATAVVFGSRPATFIVLSDTSIEVLPPTSAAGEADVTVTTPSGTSAISCNDRYIYQGNWFAYFTNTGDNMVFPINLTTNTVGTPFAVSSPTLAIAITPNGQTAVVLHTGLASTSIVDLATNTVIQTLNAAQTKDVAITPDGSSAYMTQTGALTQIILSNPATIGNSLAIPAAQLLAITPNGQFAYVTTSADTVVVVNLASNTITATIPVGTTPQGIAITPNGQFAYVANDLSNDVSVIDTASNTVIATIPVGTNPFGVAITPDGQLAFVANTTDNSVSVISTATQSVIATIPTSGTTPLNVAITPDGKTAYVTETNSSDVLPIDISTLTAGTPITAPGTFPDSIAITPDQAPFASFTFTSPDTFDASSSVTPVGSIASYSWNFGDGQTLVTTSPIVTHMYATNGAFTVTLTVTNTAGTSTMQTFTGPTASNNGGPCATTTRTITISASVIPPSMFVGKAIKNRFATQTDLINKLTWTPSSDPSVVAYRIFRNGMLIAEIPASGPFVFLDHNRRKYSVDTYELIAVNAEGVQSTPLFTTVTRR